MQDELDEIRRLADLPLILDLEMAARVFSHKSLFARPASVHVENEEPPDYERLAFLGDQVLAFLATEAIFERYPTARPSFLTDKRALVTNNEEIAKWSLAYDLPRRIKAHQSQQAVIQTSVTVRAGVFEAYIGAVFSESGLDLVGTWIKPLVRRVLDIDDFAQRTPRSDPSPFSMKGDSDLEAEDEQILLHRQVDTLSIAETTSTRFGAGTRGYELSMNQFSNRSIAPSSHDGYLNAPYSPSTTYMDTAHAQPIAVATGKQSSLRHEIRGHQLGSYSPNVPGNHSPAHLPNALNHHYSSDTIHSSPPYGHQESQQSPPFASGGVSFRSSSSSTVRPPARSPLGSPSATTGVPPPRPSPSVTSPGSSDSADSQNSTKSVTGGHLALFNQMAIQKKIEVEWKIASTGPPHRPKFDAQVFVHGHCHGRSQALTKKHAQQGAAEEALRSLGWVISAHMPEARTPFWTRADVRAWQHNRSRIFTPERQIQSLFRILFLRRK